MAPSQLFYTYMLCCNDESFYIGWTVDINNRLMQHNFGKQGAKYTRCRRPVKLIYLETFGTRKEAMKREVILKRFPRKKKMQLALLGTTEQICYYADTLEVFLDELEANQFSDKS